MTASVPYLLQLSQRLGDGLRGLPEETRDRHRQFVLSRQMSDGGFAGREPGSDLYYTGFAVRTLAMLGGLSPRDCDSLSPYLSVFRHKTLTLIDLVSLLYSSVMIQAAGGPDCLGFDQPDWSARLGAALESFRTADGGYAKTTEGAAGSVYHSFLVVLCYELIGQTVPQPKKLIQFIYDRQREDGGFVEIAPMKRSGTNPTAAAAAILLRLGGMDNDLRVDLKEYLKQVKSDEGGFLANTRIPFADSLSTFTAVLTQQDLGIPLLIPPQAIRQFIHSLEVPQGGFRGANWDEQADVEYTFYALGTLGLLGKE